MMLGAIFDPRDSSKDIRGNVTLEDKESLAAYPKDSPAERFAAEEQRSLCSTSCNFKVETDLKLVVESKPVGAFCAD